MEAVSEIRRPNTVVVVKVTSWQIIADLGCRRDRLLESAQLDLVALESLAADYESAGLVCAAASLRRRLEWYRGK